MPEQRTPPRVEPTEESLGRLERIAQDAAALVGKDGWEAILPELFVAALLNEIGSSLNAQTEHPEWIFTTAFRGRILKSLLAVGRVEAERSIVPEVFDSLLARAKEIMGDADKALRWLGTPVRGLNFATPISLLGRPEGSAQVNDVLGQMERGIW